MKVIQPPVQSASALIYRFPDQWRRATRHPFLDGIAAGWLTPAVFNRWLVQDYLFVTDLLVFQARLLARAPRSAQAVLAGGAVGLEAELAWFEDHVAGRGLSFEAAPETTTERYRLFLRTLDTAPYPVAVCALWAIERAYLDAWRRAAPGREPYAEFVQHWTGPAFGEYVKGLERAADAALAGALPDERSAVESAFVDVVVLEHAFWDMAWSAHRE